VKIGHLVLHISKLSFQLHIDKKNHLQHYIFLPFLDFIYFLFM